MKFFFIPLIVLAFYCTNCYGQNCNLSTQCGDIIADWGLANNVTFVCEGAPFEVKVNPGTTMNDIDEIIWLWGDGQTDTVADFSNQTHIYTIDDDEACEGPAQKIYEITLEIYRYCADGTSCHYQRAPVAVKFKPRAFFEFPGVVCVGEQVEFQNTSCNGDSFSWNFGDGSLLSSDESPLHEYNNAGTYQVTLMVENECGNAAVTQTIEVINSAEANIAIASDNVNESGEPFIYCLGSGLVDLNGDSLSLNETIYEWSSPNGVPGASWELEPPNQNDPTPNVFDPSISFTDTGLYRLILEVDNACNIPDFDTIFIQVLSGEALSEPNQEDACLTLDYTPENFNPDAEYTINGMLQTSFPVTLDIGEYTVICNLTNECGSQTTTDVFEVFGQENVSIISPPTDTSICVGSNPIPILYSPGGGLWVGEHLIIVDSTGEVFFDPVEVGSFSITYRKGVGDCEDVETITINVEGIAIVTSNYEVCSTSNPFLLEATPPGGVFSSPDCPTCIVGDTFFIDEMTMNALATVVVNYNVSSSLGCDGNGSFAVTIEDPSAAFTMDDVFCLGTPVTVNTANVAGSLTWLVDGQDIGLPPFLNLTGGPHTIELTAAAGDCEVVESFEIFITSPPSDVSFSATPLEGCADLEVMLLNETGSFDNPSFEWYLNDSLFSTEVQPGMITLGQGLNDTTYTISLSAGNSCDGQSFSQEITVLPLPVPNFGSMQDYYCSGDTVIFSNVSFGGPITSWLWDYGNGVTSTDSVPLEMVYYTDTIPTTYHVSLTATNNCGTEVFDYDILINPTDVQAFFNIEPIEGCVDNQICLTNLSTVGAPVLWDFGDGNTSTQANICHIYQQADTYTITLKAFGCGFDSIQTDVIIHPKPNAGFSNNSFVCLLDTISFTNASGLAVDFLWDFGDGVTSTLNDPRHFYDASGIYEVKLYATSLEGCIDSAASTITVLPLPTADFTVSTDSICENQEVIFSSISQPTPLSCFWEFGDGSTSNECTVTHQYETAGDYTATLTITDADGCRNSVQRFINVAPVPIPAFDFVKDQECSPVEVTFINQTVLGESNLWDFGDGNTSMDTNPVHIYATGDDYIVELTSVNGVCSSSISQTISINQTPDAAIDLPLGMVEGCAEFEVAFAASPVNSTFTYEWDFDDNLVSFDSTSVHTFVNPGIFNVTLIVEDSPCADTATIEIVVFEPVEATVTSVDNLCFGDLDGSIFLDVTNGTPNYSYAWSNGANTPDNNNLPAGTYGFTITDDNQCTLSDVVEISQPNAPISINILQENIVTCYGGTDGLITIEATGGTPDYTYLWESGNMTTSISNVAAGQYPVTITDANNCILEETLTVNQNDSISYVVEVSNISCFGFDDGEILFDNFVGGVPPYFATALQLDSLQGTGFNGLTPASYSFILTDGAGCTQFFNTEIIEPPQIWVELDIGTTTDSIDILLGEEVPIYSTYNVANPDFIWTPGEWLSCNDCDEPIAQPFDPTEYVVLMIDENGCTASDTVFIGVNDERRIAIPNAFSPNNDGENDVFTLMGNNPGVREITSFQIFDRWGGVMYEAKNFQLNDPSVRWNGKYNGTDVQVGNYVCLAIVNYVDGETVIWKEGFLLIR